MNSQALSRLAGLSRPSLKNFVLAGALAGAATLPAQAQTTVASDNAGNYSSWPQTANNGTGFGNWSFNNTTPNGGFSGEFLGSSYTGHGGGLNSGSGNAFGFYANSGTYANASATAPFSAGALTANETFSVQFQNDNIGDVGGQEGFNLQNSSGNNLFQLYFIGGLSDYYIKVWTSLSTGVQVDTGVGYTSGPLTLQYQQGAAGAWTFSLLEGATTEATLSSVSTGDTIWQNGISQVDLYNQNGGDLSNQNDNNYFNNLQVTVTPEPTTLALSAVSGLVLLALRRRK
jgi:hypothetical protein